MANTTRTPEARGRASTTRTKAEAGTRRDHILDLAAELFADKGVAVTTVRDIGDAAGILSGSLYHHFASKEVIVEEIVTRYLDELVDGLRSVVVAEDDPRARIEGLIRASFTAIDQHPSACEIYQNDYKYLSTLPSLQGLDRVGQEVQGIWLDAIELGVEQGVFRSDVEPRMFYRFARDAIWFTVRWRKRPSGTRGVDKLTQACSTILLDGFVVD